MKLSVVSDLVEDFLVHELREGVGAFVVKEEPEKLNSLEELLLPLLFLIVLFVHLLRELVIVLFVDTHFAFQVSLKDQHNDIVVIPT